MQKSLINISINMAVDPKVLEESGSAGKYDKAFFGTEETFDLLVDDIKEIIAKYSSVKKASA